MFTDVEKVKRYVRLGITEHDDDGIIQLLADAADASIASAISRNILSAQYTEVRNGTGTDTLVLANFPVTAIGAVTLLSPGRSVLGPPVTLLEGTDFTFTSIAIKRYYGVWPRGVMNVQVEYTAGYPQAPADLVHAATKWAALRYKELDRLGQKSKTLAGETIQFDTDEMPGDLKGIVERLQSKIPIIASPIVGIGGN